MDQFVEYIEKSRDYKETLSLARRNSLGKIWMIGGAVYKTIARLSQGQTPSSPKDYDFIIEKLNLSESTNGWLRMQNRYENPKFIKDQLKVDFCPLETLRFIKEKGLPMRIEEFLRTSPLNITSLIYDANKNN